MTALPDPADPDRRRTPASDPSTELGDLLARFPAFLPGDAALEALLDRIEEADPCR
ncbi:hypothetical protein LNKW23_22750 [Paralimibaculum aggregatum]|uniref:Anti-sigma factor NepR domain-containing protein n=1 Tax=Paralimibaculum aggregatum TaxID=3036245 RepID=A0ABQ6LMY4_9RHOB|nr:hypothetical protein [Limibaculum sp. NKW23]GMG83062.1 hypothetical protein LNKW23_22750 [Limibaculum sp. NKW23]